MSAVEVLSAPGFFSKERITAGPGFNRWIVPPAALAIHLCIGMAYGFSVFWLPLSRALGVTASVACPKVDSYFQHVIDQIFTSSCDWDIPLLALTFTLFFLFLGLCGLPSGAAGSGARPVPMQGRCGDRRPLLVRRPADRGHRCAGAPAVDLLARLGRDRGYRPGSGLHLARLDPGEVVPGPARYVDGTCHQGIRWWCHDRRTARRQADEAVLGAYAGGGVADLPDLRCRVFCIHDVRLAGLSHSGGQLEAAGVEASGAPEPGDRRPGACGCGLAHAAVLVALVGADTERHRRYRCVGHGLTAVAGGVRWPPHWGQGVLR